MKKRILFFVLILYSFVNYSQIGINTTTPQSSLDVVGNPADNNSLDGIIAPRLNGDELFEKNSVYGNAQTGAIVYIKTAASITNQTAKTINVKSPGYYYFDGTIWQKMVIGTDVTNNIYSSDGVLISNRLISQTDKTLSFSSTASTGTSHFTVDGATLNVDAVKNKIGIGTATPNAKLDIVSEGNTNSTKALSITNNASTNLISILDDGNVGVNSSAPNSILQVDGSFSLPIDNASGASFTVTKLMHTIIIPSGIASSINLPSASGLKGRIYVVKNISGATRTISSYLDMNNNSSTNIQSGNSITIQSDGTNWIQIEDSINNKVEVSAYGTLTTNAAVGTPFSNGITIDGLLFQNINDIDTTGTWYDLRLTNNTGSTIAVYMNNHNFGTEHEVNNVFNSSFSNGSTLDADAAYTWGSSNYSSVNQMDVRIIKSGVVSWYRVEAVVWNVGTSRHGLLNVKKKY